MGYVLSEDGFAKAISDLRDPSTAKAVVVGPPPMMKFTGLELEKNGVDVEKIKEENKGKTVAERVEAFQDKVDEHLESRRDIDFGEDEKQA